MSTKAGGKKPVGYSTRPGYVNHRGQVVIRNTGLPGTDHGQTVYQLGCSECGHVYGANGTDIHLRRCLIAANRGWSTSQACLRVLNH